MRGKVGQTSVESVSAAAAGNLSALKQYVLQAAGSDNRQETSSQALMLWMLNLTGNYYDIGTNMKCQWENDVKMQLICLIK